MRLLLFVLGLFAASLAGAAPLQSVVFEGPKAERQWTLYLEVINAAIKKHDA